jgi:hypothetical protein
MKKVFILFVCVLAASYPLTGCRKKPAVDAAAVREESLTLKVLKKAHLDVYPQSEILDHTLKNQETERLYGPNPEAVTEVTVARVWTASNDPVEKVREHYAKTHPHVLRDEQRPDGSVFIQLSSVEKIASAITEGVSPITLVDIRRTKLTASERSAYEGEMKTLKAKKDADLVDRKRIQELERLLAEMTIVKLSVRAEKF